jgi:hypothetical protein
MVSSEGFPGPNVVVAVIHDDCSADGHFHLCGRLVQLNPSARFWVLSEELLHHKRCLDMTFSFLLLVAVGVV